MNQKQIFQAGILFLCVLIAALTRLLPLALDMPELSNFSPLGAMALFGAAYFTSRPMAMLLPALALWVSNLLLDNIFYPQYYNGFSWFSNWEVYFSFLLVVVMGFFSLKKVTPLRVIGSGLAASVIFFVVSNFFVWLSGGMYPRTPLGLLTCYEMAIPFFRNTLMGDLVFTSVLFGAWHLTKESLSPAFQRSR